MTANNRTEPGVCPRCGDTRLIPIGDGYSVNPCPNCTGQQPTHLLAKHQPCGCIVCTCADDVRCHGCGAWHCGTHPVSEIPNAVYEQPAQPGSGDVKRFKVPALYVPYPFAEVADKDGLATVVLADALSAAKAYADDMEARYHTAHERLTAAQQRIAELERDLENERARGIHSCHDQCQRPLCVANRRIAAMREAFATIRLFAQDGIENGHDRAQIGNQYAIRDLCDDFLKEPS